MSSFTLVAGTLGCTASALLPVATKLTMSRSRTRSKGSFA